MGCGVYWQQVNEVERALRTMTRAGLGPGSLGFGQLNAIRSKLLKQIGFKFPRSITLIAKLVGLSPGRLTLWHDAEMGWMVEGRATPGAPPAYHYIDDDAAVSVMQRTFTHDDEEIWFVPDDYAGEE